MTDPAKQRIILIDLLRGVAIALMFVYHFCFDLDYFDYANFHFSSHPFWLSFRALIVSLFLGVVGFSLYLAHQRGWNRSAWFKRLSLLVLASAAVSASSYLMYPKSFIFFGILHFIALASVLGMLFLRLGYLNLLIGAAILLIGNHYSHVFFNQAPLQWIGLMTEKPLTEDYVPVFPWFGMVLVGMGLAHWSQNNQILTRLLHWQNNTRAVSTLCLAGRHSLLIYLLHQPIFLGVLYVFSTVTRS